MCVRNRGADHNVARSHGLSLDVDHLDPAWRACIVGYSLFVDPTRGLIVVALTNTAVEGVFGQFPTQIRDAIHAAKNAELQVVA